MKLLVPLGSGGKAAFCSRANLSQHCQGKDLATQVKGRGEGEGEGLLL